jgi:hypothetical protein
MQLRFRLKTGTNAKGSASAVPGHFNGPRNGSNAAHFPRLVGPDACAD